jgi:hypothetical protein
MRAGIAGTLWAVASACGGGGSAIDGAPGGDAATDARPPPDCSSEPCGSVRFYGQGDTLGDRVRFRLDDPATVAAGPPLDVGETDFTVELWLRGTLADNPNTIACGPGLGWTNSNIVVDRDRHSQTPTFGVGIQSGAVVWANLTDNFGLSLCGSTTVADGAWHHVAVDRRRADGRMRIWIDGALDIEADGPDGGLAYPDDGEPLAVCPAGLCDYSDPFLVVGAEKHGYAGISFSGWVDEVRVSRRLRYDAAFAVPTAAFASDADTVGLVHFDDGQGTTATDSSGVAGAVDGELVLGGDPEGPAWATETPFGL